MVDCMNAMWRSTLRAWSQHSSFYTEELENLVLDADGYPKLIDFGLSKPDATRTSERTSTMCGSAEYMAPEIVQHRPYDQRVDLWAFGIL
ncbi:Protein kinase, partial [Phytophthora palmivora]